ncbi:hypothetical protein [Neisseria sp. Ec49-e6-T10]|uniref:hypothetical protein n=1 Tax=Neisseria sp. Ec49-e6-T10 TaxID=3140744 RepID=UPI003EBE93C0
MRLKIYDYIINQPFMKSGEGFNEQFYQEVAELDEQALERLKFELGKLVEEGLIYLDEDNKYKLTKKGCDYFFKKFV